MLRLLYDTEGVAIEEVAVAVGGGCCCWRPWVTPSSWMMTCGMSLGMSPPMRLQWRWGSKGCPLRTRP